MTGSSWKSYLDPQIATRNRWTEQHGARAADVAAARDAARHTPGARSRGITAAVAVAFTVALIVMFFVVALHSSPPQPLFTTAPAAPAEHSAPAVSADHPTTADAAEHAATAGQPAGPTGGGGGHAAAAQ
jgi:hypothetical protein